MYKVLLCWRYLLTRYLALACIVSVMLGVATLIVVNSVMAGFSTKLRERLHGFLSDFVIEAPDFDGMSDPDMKMAAILTDPFLRDRIVAMTPTLEVFAMLSYRINGAPVTRPVHLIGIDPVGRASVGRFAEYLVRPDNRLHPSFELDRDGMLNFLRHHPQKAPGAQEHQARAAAAEPPIRQSPEPAANELLPPWLQGATVAPTKPPPEPTNFAFQTKPIGVYVGWSTAHIRQKGKDGQIEEISVLEFGDDVQLTTVRYPNLAPDTRRFVVADYIRTEMSEYDSMYVFMPLADLQEFRNLEGRATSIQIRLKNYNDAKEVKKVKEHLEAICNYYGLSVATWEDKQGVLLAAIGVERGILNVLLFMIIAVAGFGILAIFTMIVVEKTRNIGILKALGASNGGVMKIFLAYGLLLGVIGALLGTSLGIGITVYINEIEQGLTKLMGIELFPRDVYYFKAIPTDIQPMSVLLINVGAISIAVLFSVLPALRAALLHPVRALRYE